MPDDDVIELWPHQDARPGLVNPFRDRAARPAALQVPGAEIPGPSEDEAWRAPAPPPPDGAGPVFLVSDLHIGSNIRFRIAGGDVVDKAASNKFRAPGPRQLLAWFHWTARAAERLAPGLPYDIVLLGDFIDIWQAARPRGFVDTYQLRVRDILWSNARFFAGLAEFLRRTPHARLTYVAGNHDDALYEGDGAADPLFVHPFGEGAPPADRPGRHDQDGVRAFFRAELADLAGAPVTNLEIARSFRKAEFALYATHGHQADAHNRRDLDRRPAEAQAYVETGVIPLSGIRVVPGGGAGERFPFGGIGATDVEERLRFFDCVTAGRCDPEVLEAVLRFRDTTAPALGLAGWEQADVIPEFIVEFFARNRARSRARPDAHFGHFDWRLAREGGSARILVTGHTHEIDWRATAGDVYANTGTWIPRYRLAEDPGTGCARLVKRSSQARPFVMAHCVGWPEPGADAARVIRVRHLDFPGLSDSGRAVDIAVRPQRVGTGVSPR